MKYPILPNVLDVLDSPRIRQATSSLSLLIVLATWPAAAHADAGVAPDAPTATETTGRVHWQKQWRRADTWEYIVTPVLFASAFAARFVIPSPEANWRGGVLFDEDVRKAAAVDPSARNAVEGISGIPFFGAMAYRLVDSLILPPAIHGNWDVALQMAMVDLEAFGTYAFVLWNSQLFVARERPYMRFCGEPGHEDLPCGTSDDNRSFIAGHFATPLVAAGLTCLHHGNMPLYGGGFWDDFACGASVALALSAGALRVMSQNHYATDVILGAGIGVAAGWLVPMAMHYGFGDDSAEAGNAHRILITPQVSARGVGLSIGGTLTTL